MSDETYYTVLNVKETASASEIKTAYRDLIKQVHPDTIANTAPYLRRIAEEKAKEITEAYSVLSNPSKRRDYDRQLAEYRRQSTPQAPPPAPPTPQPATSSGLYCSKCGTSLYASGFCPTCNKSAAPSNPSQPKVVRWFGYNWAPLMHWGREHPILALAIPVFLVWIVAASLYSNGTSSKGDLNCPASQRVEVNGHLVCQQLSAQPSQAALTTPSVAPPRASTVVSEGLAKTTKPTVSVSGTYTGTVRNQTANVASTFTAVIHQTKAGALEGCMEVKPPLYGSGVLRGSVHGSQVDFSVADITFQGNISKNEIIGSYVVTRHEGNQLGDFRLTKQTGVKESYSCADGAVVQFEILDTSTPKAKFVAKTPASTFAVVTGQYGATIYKRCAFLPSENFGGCSFGPEEVAELKKGDRVRVLSPLTRAQSGDDIYRVRTPQGWEGWARANEITLEPQ